MLKRYYSRRNLLRRFLVGSLALGLVRAQKTPWPQGMELEVTLAYEGGGFRYRNPYVAVFVEDEGGNLVRTLALFVMPGKGERWWNELKRIFLALGPEGMRTRSGPTRPPGRYRVVWDGRDERGQPVAQGAYYICVEYAREHGPYELFRERVEVGRNPFQKTYPREGELKEVTLAFRRKA